MAMGLMTIAARDASAPDDQDNYVPIFDDDAPDADDQDDYVPIFDDV